MIEFIIQCVLSAGQTLLVSHGVCRSHNLNKWDLYDDLSYIISYATKNSVPDEVSN